MVGQGIELREFVVDGLGEGKRIELRPQRPELGDLDNGMRGKLGLGGLANSRPGALGWDGRVAASRTLDRATVFHCGWQMGLNLTTRAEKLLTWLGMWGAMRGFLALPAALIASVALVESLTPPLTRLLSAVPVSVIHVFAVGIGLLLGLLGYFAGEFWDRVVFEACYGPQGWWLDSAQRPLLIFPVGSALKRHRNQAVQALPRKPDTGEGIYREAAKVARRQVERWERIEHPLILARFVRGFLWPCLFVACLACCAAAILPFVGAATEAPRLLAAGGGCLGLTLLLLVPYSHLRVEHMTRLYQDVAAHAGKRKPERR